MTAAPAHAVCVSLFSPCPASGPTATTAPPPAPVTSPPPVVAPTAPALPAAIDPDQAATEFFDDLNAARAEAGLPALAWRADVAIMAVAHSVEMAQQGTIWHGSFVTDATIKSLNASSLGENVGMGGAVGQVHDAFMNSPHHRENILDPAFNQIGVGVIVTGSTLFVTEDFLQAKGGPASARPAPVAHPVVKKPAAAPAPSRVAAAPKRAAAPTTSAPPSTAPVTAPPTTAAVGVVAAVPFDAVPAASPAPVGRGASSPGSSLVWAALLGAVLLAGSAGGHVVARRRRRT